jgi:hypothetical protein
MRECLAPTCTSGAANSVNSIAHSLMSLHARL